MAVGMPWLVCCECVGGVRGRGEVLELLVPAPVDDAGDVEGFADQSIGSDVDDDARAVGMPDKVVGYVRRLGERLGKGDANGWEATPVMAGSKSRRISWSRSHQDSNPTWPVVRGTPP